MHNKFDDVLHRQRSYGLRDWLIGLAALMVVLVHLAGMSGGAWLPGHEAADPDTAKATPAQLIHQHTSDVCGETERPLGDLTC